MITKYAVIYQEPKKKGFFKHSAVFYDLEDAYRWEQHVNSKLHLKTEIIPLFNWYGTWFEHVLRN